MVILLNDSFNRSSVSRVFRSHSSALLKWAIYISQLYTQQMMYIHQLYDTYSCSNFFNESLRPKLFDEYFSLTFFSQSRLKSVFVSSRAFSELTGSTFLNNVNMFGLWLTLNCEFNLRSICTYGTWDEDELDDLFLASACASISADKSIIPWAVKPVKNHMIFMLITLSNSTKNHINRVQYALKCDIQ